LRWQTSPLADGRIAMKAKLSNMATEMPMQPMAQAVQK
jgi:hypothetical protein